MHSLGLVWQLAQLVIVVHVVEQVLLISKLDPKTQVLQVVLLWQTWQLFPQDWHAAVDPSE